MIFSFCVFILIKKTRLDFMIRMSDNKMLTCVILELLTLKSMFDRLPTAGYTVYLFDFQGCYVPYTCRYWWCNYDMLQVSKLVTFSTYSIRSVFWTDTLLTQASLLKFTSKLNCFSNWTGHQILINVGKPWHCSFVLLQTCINVSSLINCRLFISLLIINISINIDPHQALCLL